MLLSALRDENEFIIQVLTGLPAEYMRGYSNDADEDEDSDTASMSALDRHARQQELRGKLHAKLALLKDQHGSLSSQKRLRLRLNRLERRGTGRQSAGRTAPGRHNARLNAVSTDKKRRMIACRTVADTDEAGGQPPVATKPVYNAEGRMVFSKFDFACSELPDDGGAPPGKSSRLPPGAALARARHLQERQQRRAAEDPPAARQQLWDAALRKAAGEKLRDDPQLLARSVRRQRQTKQRSKRQWDERLDRQQRGVQERQQKRSGNIQQRSDGKKKRQVDKLKKKGRILPGF